MPRQEIPLGDPQLESLARMLAASVNARILHHLVQSRRTDPRQGWCFLSEIAAGLGESPGTVSLGIQKLMPLLEERRHKGRRYFRARTALTVVLQPFPDA